MHDLSILPMVHISTPSTFRLSRPFATIVCLGLSAMPFNLNAQAPQTAEALLPELARILDAAKEQAPALIEQGFLRQEADERLIQAKADYYPRVDLNTNLGYEKEYREGGAEDRSDFGLTYSARLTRPLYHWGAIEARIEQARIDNDTETLNYLINSSKIFRSIKSDYLTLLLNHNQIEAELLHRAILESELAQVKSDYESGNISERSYLSKQLDLRKSLLIIDRIERDQIRIRENFSRNAGWEEPLDPDSEIPSPDLKALISWINETSKTRSVAWTEYTPDFQIASKAVEKQLEELTIIQSRKRPLINFSASASQDQSNTSTRNNVDTFSLFAGISVNWNVFDGFKTKHEMIEAKLKQRRLEARLDRVSYDLIDERKRMLNQIHFQAEQNEVLESRLEIETLNYADQKQNAKAGQLSESQLKEFELTLKRLKIEVMAARAELFIQLSDYFDLTMPGDS